MKKRLVICLLVLMSLLVFSGCEKSEEEGRKSVVIYFSATGNTRTFAEKIAKESDSDIIEIIPKEKYTDNDLSYDVGSRSTIEQNDPTSRPEIENKIDISKYDTVYLGFPIWWGYNPRIIYTLLDSYDFSNKKIIPFCTSGSSDIADSVIELRKTYENLTIEDGKRFDAEDTDKVVEEFVENNK